MSKDNIKSEWNMAQLDTERINKSCCIFEESLREVLIGTSNPNFSRALYASINTLFLSLYPFIYPKRRNELKEMILGCRKHVWNTENRTKHYKTIFHTLPDIYAELLFIKQNTGIGIPTKQKISKNEVSKYISGG